MNAHDNPQTADRGNDVRSERLELVIPDGHAGQRLDQVLAALCPEWSRSRISRWIRDGKVTLAGEACKPRDRVAGGEAVVLEASFEQQVAPAPQAIDLDIRYRDEDLMVLYKPAGLVVHPGAGNPDGTLQNGLLHMDASRGELPRAGIVHRIDKNTSGLLLVASSQRAHTALVDMFSRHAVERHYLAVVKGRLIAGDTVEAPIGRHPNDRRRQMVLEHGGKPAVTHYRVKERYRAHSLVECRLETGRTHQIRVHMAHVRHGLVGDPVYGGPPVFPRGASEALMATLRGFGRQALHAAHLGFVHPVTGEKLAFESDCPSDMRVLIDALRADAGDA